MTSVYKFLYNELKIGTRRNYNTYEYVHGAPETPNSSVKFI